MQNLPTFGEERKGRINKIEWRVKQNRNNNYYND